MKGAAVWPGIGYQEKMIGLYVSPKRLRTISLLPVGAVLSSPVPHVDLVLIKLFLIFFICICIGPNSGL